MTNAGRSSLWFVRRIFALSTARLNVSSTDIEAMDNGQVTTTAGDAAVVDAVIAFFAEHAGASLRLPSGWFGRPYDNQHQLTEAKRQGEIVVIRLDRKQVLTLKVEGASSDHSVLRVAIQGGHWCWTEYGADTEHSEVLGPGTVEFHAPV